ELEDDDRVLAGDLERGEADIAGEAGVEAGLGEHQVDERGGGRLALGAGDGDDLAAGAIFLAPEVEVGGDGNAGFAGHGEDGAVARDAGALDDGAEAAGFDRLGEVGGGD